MKLKKRKRKFYWFPRLAKLYQEYKKLMKECEDFDWSFIKFIWLTKLTGMYALHTLRNRQNNDYHFILILRIDKIQKELEIRYSYIGSDILKDPMVLQAFNIQINQYSLFDYNSVFIQLDTYNKELKRLFEDFTHFQQDDKRNIISSIKSNGSKIILIKKF